MTDLARAAADPGASAAQLRGLVVDALRHGRGELGRSRSGYERVVEVAFAEGAFAVAPVDAAMRADPEAAPERAWLLVAATIGALVELASPGPPTGAGDLLAGELDGFLVLRIPGSFDPELAPLAFEEQVAGIDRLRACAVAVPAAALSGVADLREPINSQLRVAEAVARLGGRPADPVSVEEHEDAVAALVGGDAHRARPHEDPDPARRVARRILQRLNGMGKWGGYHTEFAHLPRGFAGNERSLAIEVGEALLSAGLLAEKPSVGQRHVFLNPRRAGDIHRMIETGQQPENLTLPS